MRICICGGGALGHVCAGVFAADAPIEIYMLTNRPALWNSQIVVTDPYGKQYIAPIKRASSNPADIIPIADVVLLCQPGYLIEKTLVEVAPFLQPETYVGSVVASTGFFFQAHHLLPVTTKLFGFQRVPFIARVKEYGKSASLLGYKPCVHVACENVDPSEHFCERLASLLRTPVKLLNNFYEASLTNSNPILHTGRLYSMWHDWDGRRYNQPIKFYHDWDAAASELLIRMDEEFMQLVHKLPIASDAILPLLTYYESSDALSLTRKIHSIEAFQSIEAPMKEVDGGWIPDFESRYFTEDFPYGLRYIKELAEVYEIATPTIDCVYLWGAGVLEGK